MTDLSERTLAEQKAGRNAIFEAVQAEMLAKGDELLRKKFPTYLGNPHLAFDPIADDWAVEVRIKTATGTFLNFTEPFLGWPSDQLITNMMLVEP